MKWNWIGVIIIAISGCVNAQRDECSADSAPERHPVVADTPAQIILPPVSVHYSVFKIDRSTFKQLTKSYTKSELNIILALNRVDFERLQLNDSLVIPDTFFTDFSLYSPFPVNLPITAGVRKLLVFSYPVQAFAAYENGQLVRWGPVSMGKESTPTPTGLLHTNWRARTTVSTDDSTWILNWYYNIDNDRGVSLHQYELPGYPASHACVRMMEADAKWVYYWADGWKLNAALSRIRAYGTPVVIFGAYDFNAEAPWYKLLNDMHANTIHPDTLTREVTTWLPLILERQRQRDSVEGNVAYNAVD